LLKVVHLVAGDLSGGAARAALSYHRALKSEGIESNIIVQFGNSVSTDIHIIDQNKFDDPKRRIRFILDQLPYRIYNNEKKYIFSPGIFGMDLTDHKLIKNSDIVHLHWITNAFIDLKSLRGLNKPLVWTLHDMWAFTGGCHYSLDCRNYRKECGNCFQLKSNKPNDLSNTLLRRKKKIYDTSFTPVSVSEWLKKSAEESYLLSDKKVEVIPNGVELQKFQPKESKTIRRKLNVPVNRKIILVDGQCTKHIWKGRRELESCLKELKEEEFFFLFFGSVDEKFTLQTGITFKNFGKIEDDNLLCDIYNSADIFLTSTVQEAFGMTIIEAMACGLPVVCFNTTGPAEIVDHLKTGYKADAFKPADLAEGVKSVISDEAKRKKLGANARENVETYFDIKITALKYVDLYKSLVTVKAKT
jgi:glycosyltransferase involved in cell wall biosynthesis